VIAVAVSTTSLPALSQRAAQADRTALLDTLSHTLRLMLTLLVPATAGLLLLAGPIVALLFQYGEFSADRSTPMTAAALAFYSLGLPAYGLVKGLAQGFYSVQDTRTPVKIGAICMVANVILNLTLIGPLGLRGLALATSLAAWLTAGLRFGSLATRVGAVPRDELLRSAGRTAAASVALAFGASLGLVVGGALAQASWPAPIERALPVGTAIVFGLGAFLAAGKALRHAELDDVLAALRGILARR
jgi:putative peptidoglycan lipid II flippase